MRPIHLAVSLFLLLLGAASFVGTGMVHPTALVPVWFGLMLLLLGWFENRQAPSRGWTLLLYLWWFTAIVGTASGLAETALQLFGAEGVSPTKATVQSLMFLSAVIHLLRTRNRIRTAS